MLIEGGALACCRLVLRFLGSFLGSYLVGYLGSFFSTRLGFLSFHFGSTLA
jgi:hypothetical protein